MPDKDDLRILARFVGLSIASIDAAIEDGGSTFAGGEDEGV